MTDRPIILSAPMVRAILDGRKTMTRRILKPIAGLTINDILSDGDRCAGGFRCLRQQVRASGFSTGDTLWVREAWRAHAEHDPLPPCDIPPGAAVQYVADEPLSPWLSRYRHARFMPRWASRITLRVTGVKVERLQDISEADALAEGVEFQIGWLPQYRGSHDLPWVSEFPRDAFCDLWNNINGPGSWDANPWVCAMTFERIAP